MPLKQKIKGLQNYKIHIDNQQEMIPRLAKKEYGKF